MTNRSLPLFCILGLTFASAICVLYHTQKADGGPVFNEQYPPEFSDYPLGPDSRVQPGVPVGKTFVFELTNSKIFPQTTRTITVYVPAEYTEDKPACTFVELDHLDFNTPIVFDNLIAQHAMPVTIAIGIAPGVIDSAAQPENPRFDRSFEFDSLTDRLARFLLEEVIPQVESHHTPNGLPIRLSTSADDRAIAGASTGGIGSFTVAWERPDAFHRVFSAIGTFVGMRGGDQYYVLVRKTEPKPLRIFLQDGVHDEWLGGPEMGDWWMSNETMNRALEFAGYDVKHIWGAGAHNGNQAAAIFPKAMRWLWHDWPAPIIAQAPGNPVLQQILKTGETWRLLAANCDAARTLASDPQGRVYYRSAEIQPILELKADGNKKPCGNPSTNDAFAFGPDGKVYLARPQGGIEIRARADGPVSQTRARNLLIRSVTVLSNGEIYGTTALSNLGNELWLIPRHGEPKRLDGPLKDGKGIAISPDGLWLFLSQRRSRSGISYRILEGGTVDAREPFYDFYVATSADDSDAGEIAMDSDGRAYVATGVGVQVFDRNGRVTAVLPLPGNEKVTGICFGGPHFDTLYVSGDGHVYERELNVEGAQPWAPPSKLPPWGAG